MSAVRSVAIFLSCLLAANSIALQINAFWLTDGSLFQQPVEFSGSQFVDSTSPPAQSQSLSSTTASSIKPSEAHSRSQVSTAEPWLQLATGEGTRTELIGSTKTAQNITQDTSNGFVGNNNAACQCDSGWIQNQTGAWLNKWLTSPQFASHMKSLGLSSIARGNSSTGGQNINGNNPRSSSLAWNKIGTRRNERNSQQGQPNRAAASGHNHRASAASSVASHTRRAHNGQRSVQQQALAPAVKAVQGERGPKGDRGERGPSGLISVKDRDALFDLPSATSGARMAFVESEQLLVLETPGPSWRPVPLLAPLHDFRKTIAKFNLNSAEERRRLLAGSDGRPVVIGQDGQSQVVLERTGSGQKGQLAAVPRAPDSSVAAATEQLFERAVVKSNTILGALDSTPGAAGVGRAAGLIDAGEDDDEEEEEEDEDDDDEDDLNMEDDDDEDGSSDDDDEEDNQIGADERPRPAAPGGKGARGLIDSLMVMTNEIPEAGRVVTGGKRARNSQVASRSAMSAGGGNSLSAALERADSDTAGDAMTGDVMRLRLVALNEPFSGNQHGLRGANFECKRNAARAGVKGAFRALLATNYQNLNEIVRYNSHVQKYPIVNLRGDTLASSWHDLFKAPARAINPLSRIQSFDGRHVASDPNWPNKLVWLGTGSKFGHRDSSSHNCDGWHADSLNKLGFATPLHSPKAHLHAQRQHPHGDRKRSQQRRHADDEPANSLIAARNSTSSLVFDVIEKYPCRMPLIVLCIETVAQAE